MRRALFAIPLLLGALGLQAQDASGPVKRKEPPPGVLHTLTIRGAHLYTAAAIVQASGLKPGQKINAAQLEAARKQLQDTELFNNVTDEYRFSNGPLISYDVTFEVTENPQVFPIRFERLGVPDETVRAYLKEHVPLYLDRIPGTESVLRRYSQAVQAALAEANKPVKVKGQISNDDPQQLAILFTSSAPAPNISQVVVSGNKAVDTGAILRAVNQVAIGVPLSDTRLHLILDGAIKPLYAAKGYAAVTFPKIETEPSTANLGVVVKVQIQDGPQFKFGPIRFRGNGIDEEEIRTNITFKPGQTFNGELVDNFRLEMTRRMRKRGLLDAAITTDAQPDDVRHIVSITYSVTPGAVYNFGRLDIHGLDSTTEPVVAKLWGEKPGTPFNPDYPDFFLKRLGEQNLFDNLKDTQADYRPDESTHSVTVNLYFKGGAPTTDEEQRKKDAEQRKHPDPDNPNPPES